MTFEVNGYCYIITHKSLNFKRFYFHVVTAIHSGHYLDFI